MPRALIALILAAAAVLGIAACSGGEDADGDTGVDPKVSPVIAASLLAEHGCTNCHVSPDWAYLPPTGGPSFLGIAERTQYDWLHGFLTEPDTERRRCPDGLHGVDAAARAETADDILHYFRYVSEPMSQDAHPGLWNPDAGGELFRRIGCIGCHDDELADRAMSERWNLPALSVFLHDPLAERPHDLMPDCALTLQEATWIASWLLREQEPLLERALSPGLEVSVYVFPEQPANLAALEGLEPVKELVSTDISVAHRTQDERFGLVFEGLLDVSDHILAAVYTRSDDGSRMWIAGALVVDNDGHHAPQSKTGGLELQPGLHSLRIEMFEAGGGEELSAGWYERGEEVPFAAEELFHGALKLPPTGWEDFELDESRAVHGLRALESCLACHRNADEPPEPTLPWSDPDAGCLSSAPVSEAPQFDFDDATRESLRGAVRTAIAAPRASLTAQDRVTATLNHLGCVDCHVRQGVGEPAAETLQHFTGEEDLGDEGVRPPDLTGVGAKLTTLEMKRVLVGDSRVRPFMRTRMPSFAPQYVAELAKDFADADAGMFGDVQPQPVTDRAAAIEAGRTLVGTGGFACVSCHTVAGHRSPGIQGMDLAGMAGQLRPEWFRRWLLDPPGMRPGTRMPGFFPGGTSVQHEILGGDAEAQVAALWTYLSLGDGMPIPEGTQIDSDAYELVPVDRPIYVGTFFADLSARTTCVGFPERVHAAFDQHNVRLGALWGGDFLDVAGTWDGRAGELESPASPWDRVRYLPYGPSVVRLDAPDAEWPIATGRAAGWRMRAHRRDADGRPTWVYAQGDLVVEESLTPHFSGDGAHLTRHFRVTNPGDAVATMRAWGRSYFVAQEEGGWLAEGRMHLQVHGAESRIYAYPLPPDHDLRIEIPAGAIDFEFEVEMKW